MKTVFELCDLIRETAYAIHLYHGHGHLEKVYENALAHRLRVLGLHVEQQHPVEVRDEDGTVLGDYYADLFVENRIIIELKACKAIANEHVAQVLGYMKSTRIEHGLLINFGSYRFWIKKYVLSDIMKPTRPFYCLPIFSSLLAFALFAFPCGQSLAADPEGLQPIKYNNSGLVVDLEVGLWAWPVPCDADGDGDFDLMVSCPDKPHNGVYLFENITGDTAQNPMPVFAPGRFISKTAHYVMPSYTPGGMRVLTPGTEHPNFIQTGLDQKVKLPIAAKWYKPKGTQPKGPKTRHNQWRYVDYDGDGKLDLVVGIEDWSYYGWDDAWNAEGVWQNGPLHGFVFVFRNTGGNDNPKYEKEFRVMPVDTFGCPSPNFEDFDKDGDLDLLCGEFLDGFTYFENIGTRTEPKYAKGIVLKDAAGKPVKMDLEMIAPVAFDWDKDGDFDLICGDEDGRVAFIENTGKLSAEKTPVFAQPRYFQQEADEVNFGALATLFSCDWDGDKDTDIIAGNTAGYIAFFENLSGPGVAQPKLAQGQKLKAGGETLRIMAGKNGSIQGPAEAKWGYTTQTVADWDGDGDLDIVANSILGKVVWYENTGSATAPALAAAKPVEVEWLGEQPRLAWGWLRPEGKGLLTQWRTTPVAVDWNKDGLTDLVMLDHEGYLAFFERKKADGKLLLLPPKRIFADENGKLLQLNAGTAGKSGRRKLCLMDWDGDGKLDILLNSQNAQFLRQTGEKDGLVLFKDSGNVSERNIEGHDTSPTPVDWDGNGLPDLLIGAEDGRFYFLKNPKAP